MQSSEVTGLHYFVPSNPTPYPAHFSMAGNNAPSIHFSGFSSSPLSNFHVFHGDDSLRWRGCITFSSLFHFWFCRYKSLPLLLALLGDMRCLSKLAITCFEHFNLV
ncbi:unnamed protein product, partial [Vitis vinifera]